MMGVGHPCPPIRNDIVTPESFVWNWVDRVAGKDLSSFQLKFLRLQDEQQVINDNMNLVIGYTKSRAW